MAIFKKPVAKYDSKVTQEKKEVKKRDKAVKQEIDATIVKVTMKQRDGKELDLESVLLRPHVTEKATDLSEKGVYAFEINLRANKMHVRRAVEKFYKVKPIKVAVLVGKNKYMKNQKSGRIQVKKTGGKKALVYLKKGEKIEFS